MRTGGKGRRIVVPLLLIILAVASLSGCLGWLMPADTGVPPKVFGIVNTFPEHPQYIKKKTLVAGHKVAMVESISVKNQLTEMVARFLEESGYRAVSVDDRSALTSGQVDMLIEIVPKKAMNIKGLFACGFSDRKFLLGLVNQPPRSYIGIQLALSRKNSTRVVTTRPQGRFSQLNTDMPDTWEALSRREKKRFEANLRENLAKATYLSLKQLKI